MSDIKYSVTIRDETGSGTETVAGASEQTAARPGTPLSQGSAERSASTGKLATALVAVKAVEPYVNQAVAFTISRIEFSTGSTELQQRAQIFSGAASSAYSIGMAAIVGGLPAAAVVAGAQILQTAISAMQNAVAIQDRKALEAETIANKKSRIGAISNRSRGARQ